MYVKLSRAGGLYMCVVTLIMVLAFAAGGVHD